MPKSSNGISSCLCTSAISSGVVLIDEKFFTLIDSKSGAEKWKAKKADATTAEEKAKVTTMLKKIKIKIKKAKAQKGK